MSPATPDKAAHSFTVPFRPKASTLQSRLTLDSEVLRVPILVVDDNAVTRKVFKRLIEKFGFKVDVASSGEEAIETLSAACASSNPYGLILLDWEMEGINGLQTAEIIRDRKDIETPAIIMVSSHSHEQIANKTSNFHPVISGPVNPTLMFNTIAAAVHKHTNHPFPIRKARRMIEPESPSNKYWGNHALIVEDNFINQQVAVQMLAELGITSKVLSNGLEAVIETEQNSYDLIPMDMQMPVMDGSTGNTAHTQTP